MPTLKNKKHERFCREYVIDHNGTQAAIRAEYSEKTAQQQSSRLLLNVVIMNRIAELNEKVSDKLELTVEKVLKDIEELREKALEENQFAASLKASELQGKHLKMFVDKMEVTGKDGGPIETEYTVEFVPKRVDENKAD